MANNLLKILEGELPFGVDKLFNKKMAAGVNFKIKRATYLI